MNDSEAGLFDVELMPDRHPGGRICEKPLRWFAENLSDFAKKSWSGRQDSNLRPLVPNRYRRFCAENGKPGEFCNAIGAFS
jgi:hypothetical protein